MRSGFITQSVRNYSERYKYEISANIPQGLNCYSFGEPTSVDHFPQYIANLDGLRTFRMAFGIRF